MSEAFDSLVLMFKTRRKALGLTQVEAARLLGVGLEFVNRLEQAHPRIEAGKVFDCLEKLGIDVYGKERLRPPAPTTQNKSSDSIDFSGI